MTDPDALVRLAFAAIRCPKDLDRGRITDLLQTAPEGSRDSAIIRVFQGAGQLAVFDQFRVLTAELKFVPEIVNRP